MDSSAYLFPGIAQIGQLSPTPRTVIILGQLPSVPLMCPGSELGYGLEPHDYIYSRIQPAAACGPVTACSRMGVPGVGAVGGYREGYTGYLAEAIIEAYLMNY